MTRLRYDPELGGSTFDTPTGPRLLKDPGGPPTGRQLLKLAHAGLLAVRDEPGPRVSKLDAALALDHALARQGDPV